MKVELVGLGDGLRRNQRWGGIAWPFNLLSNPEQFWAWKESCQLFYQDNRHMLSDPEQIWTHRHLGKGDPRCGAWVTACIGWCWPNQGGWEAEWLDERRRDNKLRFGLVDFKVFGDIHLEKKQQATLFQTPRGTCLECGFQAWREIRVSCTVHICWPSNATLGNLKFRNTYSCAKCDVCKEAHCGIVCTSQKF